MKIYMKDDPNASYRLLAREFIKRGYSVEEEVVDHKTYIAFTSSQGMKWRTRASNISYPFTTEEMRLLSRHKEAAYTFVEKLDVAVPYTIHLARVSQLKKSEAMQLFDTYKTLIVKPSDSSLARGLTLNIRSYEKLRNAISFAREVSPTVLVQEQVEGEEVRFALIDGKVRAALLRRTPRVTGDGVSSIAELIQKENESRTGITSSLAMYPQLTETMIGKTVFTDTRIPAKGETVELSRATMLRHGCSMYNILDELHPSYVRKVEELGAHLSTKFVVIDMFLQDYKSPCSKRNYWFIEFNTSPVLSLFYSCRDGKQFAIVPELVATIDRYLHREKQEKRTTLGSFEPVKFPEFTTGYVTAKIDTGAYSGALYATNVQEQKDNQGRSYIEYDLLGDISNKKISYDYYIRSVRSAHGHVVKRYVVKLDIEIKGKIYSTEIGLSNRSEMKFPVLIGRRFLREHDMIVDVTVNEEMDYEKENLG